MTQSHERQRDVFCMQIDFPGTMYITDRHTCFAASSGSVSFSLPHKAKQTVKKILQGVGSGTQSAGVNL